MSKPTEVAAFSHSILVTWGDCDPAFIAYTGRIPCWALQSIDAWWAHNTGLDWYALNVDRSVGTPFVHMTIDFRSPITPRHRLDCTVDLVKLGSSSIRYAVNGYQDGKLCFEGQFVAAFVDAKSFLSRQPPADLRAILVGCL